MNKYERKMIDVLQELKEKYNVYGVKAEFEAEGTRTEDLIKLMHVVVKSNLPICLKIGGCEAIRDIDECKLFNVDAVMAPMIESGFAMGKFISACEKAYNKFDDEYDKVEKVVNLETVTAFGNMDEIFTVGKDFIDSVVVGRSDLSKSLNIPKNEINDAEMYDYTRKICEKSKSYGFISSFGGSISVDSIDFIKRIEDVADRFETRKIVFQPKALNNNYEKAIVKALEFEYYYLKNKFNYYDSMAQEDMIRFKELDKRMKK